VGMATYAANAESNDDDNGAGDTSITTQFDSLMHIFSERVQREFTEQKRLGSTVHFSEELALSENTFPKTHLQPFERYCGVNASVRMHLFFESLHPYDVLIGRVQSTPTSPTQSLQVVVLQRIDRQQRYIVDLNIDAVVDPNNWKHSNESSSSGDESIKCGDLVKGVVTYVNRGGMVVHMSFQEKHLRKDQNKHFPLGKISEGDEAEYASVTDEQEVNTNGYMIDLEKSTAFTDPHSIKRILNELNIGEQYTSLLGNSTSTCGDGSGEGLESAKVIREKQSSKWSMDMVSAGVKHLKESRHKEAMKCFDQSISFYPKNAEAFVARGALKANRNELKDAVEDFKEALRINSKHRNAQKYMVETLSNIARRYEREKKWKEAVNSYADILDIDSQHKEAHIRSQHIKKKILADNNASDTISPPSQNSDTSSSPGKKRKTLSVKSKERLKKLKSLLQAEVEESESSSSTTTSSSSSETNSSGEEGEGEGDWVEKPCLPTTELLSVEKKAEKIDSKDKKPSSKDKSESRKERRKSKIRSKVESKYHDNDDWVESPLSTKDRSSSSHGKHK